MSVTTQCACRSLFSPLGSSLTTSRPFRHTTFPVAASTNTSEGMLVTLYLFHSFICRERWGGGREIRRELKVSGRKTPPGSRLGFILVVDGKQFTRAKITPPGSVGVHQKYQSVNKCHQSMTSILENNHALCCLKEEDGAEGEEKQPRGRANNRGWERKDRSVRRGSRRPCHNAKTARRTNVA